MSLDGPNIIDGDLAHDVRNTFLDLYDKGLEIEDIRREMARLKREMAFNDLDREIFCSVMCQTLWDVGHLKQEDIDELAQLVRQETGLKQWKKLGEDLYESRKQVLNRQLLKLPLPKSRPRGANRSDHSFVSVRRLLALPRSKRRASWVADAGIHSVR